MSLDVKRLAGLAKIRVEDDEAASLGAKMRAALRMMEEDLPAVDGQPEPPDEYDAMTLRPDVIRPSLGREELLAGAPEKNAGCFVVPKTI